MKQDDGQRQPIDGEFPKPLLLGCLAAIIAACVMMKYVLPPLIGAIFLIAYVIWKMVTGA